MQTSSTHQPSESPREPFSLLPLLTILWGYRRPALLAILTVVVLYTTYALTVTLRAPVERTAAVGFRVLFEGAESGQYPNGDPFSPSDVVSVAVLSKVHTDNDLQRYLSIEELKAALVVTQSSPELIIMTQAYEARLANPSLTQVARAEIEQEFLQRRAALRVPEMALQFVRNAQAQAMPDELLQKVLLEILDTWATFSRDRRGVQMYSIEVLSGSFADQEFGREVSVPIKIDMLRRRVDSLIHQSDVLAEIPGVHHLTATPSGRTNAEIRSQLDDLRGFELQIALSSSLRSLLPADAVATDIYLRTRLNEVERKLAQQRSALKRFEETLGVFSADSIPTQQATGRTDRAPQGGQDAQQVQLSESLLTTLMAMARRQEDFEYRRTLAGRIIAVNNEVAILEGEKTFYLQAIEDLSRRSGSARTAAIEASFAGIEAQIKAALTAQHDIYKQISALHLDRGGIYRVTVGYGSTTRRGVMVDNLIYGGLSVLLLSLILIPLACLGHHTLRVRRHRGASVA